jgi:hypothetical protein
VLVHDHEDVDAERQRPPTLFGERERGLGLGFSPARIEEVVEARVGGEGGETILELGRTGVGEDRELRRAPAGRKQPVERERGEDHARDPRRAARQAAPRERQSERRHQ